MRIEENQFSRLRWKGKLGNCGYTLSPAAKPTITVVDDGMAVSFQIDSLPLFFNFYRDLGDLLDHLQPGLVNSLPEGDPSEVDAMKIIYEADQLRKER